MLVFCIVVLVVLLYNLANIDIAYSLRGAKEINNIVELEHTEEGSYVRVKYNKAYETDQLYYIKYEPVGKFIDIEINGKVLVSILDLDTAKSILESEKEPKYIEGKLIHFKEENMLEGLNNIKQNYLEDFGWELSEDEIIDMFASAQLLNYGIKRPNVIITIVLILSSVFVLVCIGILIIRIIRPNLDNIEKVKIKGKKSIDISNK